MRFVCDSCGTKYSLPDEKVRHKKILKVRCKNCGHVITVREAGRAAAARLEHALDKAFEQAFTDAPGAKAPAEAGAAAEPGEPEGRLPPAEEAVAPSVAGGGRPRRKIWQDEAPPAEETAVSAAEEAAAPAAEEAAAPAEEAAAPAEEAAAPAEETAAPVAEEAAPPVEQDAAPAEEAAPLAPAGEAQEPRERQEPQPPTAPAAPSTGTGEEAAASPRDDDGWHLGADGSEYGPMPLAELRARLGRGEATRDDHVWREGFDGWRRVRDVAELRAHVGKRRARRAGGPPPLPSSDGRAALPAPPRDTAEHAVVASAETLARPFAEPPQDPAVHVANIPGGPVAVGTGYAQAGWPPGLKVGVGVITALLVAILGLTSYALFLREPDRMSRPTLVAAPRAAPSASPAPTPEAPDGLDPSVLSIEKKIEAAQPGPPNAPAATAVPARGSVPATSGAAPAKAVQPTAAQQKLAALYQEVDTSKAPDVPRVPGLGQKKTVTAADLDRVRLENQTALKICYERAVKRDPSLRRVRVDVQVDVNEAGAVSGVELSSLQADPLGTCLTQTIRRWTFPSTGEPYSASFPIIFQGG